MPTNAKPIIALSAGVNIEAAVAEGDAPAGPPKFTATFYTGGAMNIDGWELPVVIDLAGLEQGNVLVANLDHDRTKRVGNFAVANDGKTLVANGTASAATDARREVVESAAAGYQWQASLEVQPKAGGVETVKAGKTVEVNGQQLAGPLYVTRQGVLKGFAFVSHGADDNTTASIAAIAAASKEKTMDPKFKAWVEAMGFDADNLSDAQLAGMQANYDGKNAAPKAIKFADAIEAKAADLKRIEDIGDIALNAAEKRPLDLEAIRKLANDAIEGGWSVEKFRIELLESTIPVAANGWLRPSSDRNRLTNKVVEAAICLAGNLNGVDKMFDDQTLQTAHDRYKNGIGLKQLLVEAAQANGYNGGAGYNVDIEVQRAAFGMHQGRINAAGGFSTFSLPNTLAASSNKFLREGWMSVDQTPLRIASVRSVRDFKTITTVSLTGGFQFEKVAPGGELTHAVPSELSYTNKADTYGIMFGIPRTDIINDDLGALTAVPRRIGRGGMLKLNDIFWAEFLNNSDFFKSANLNVNEAVADMTTGGLTATETIFMSQTDADGKPLGSMPAILLVPTALKSKALALMTSEKIKGDADEPDGNVWRGRFRVESSPYMHNTSYTGNSAAAWYMLADPNDIPVIEIAALNGRVEPTVETADADFNTLGVQMRGYSDVGVNLQEFRGGVRADGGSS